MVNDFERFFELFLYQFLVYVFLLFEEFGVMIVLIWLIFGV